MTILAQQPADPTAAWLFYIFALMSVISAIGVVATRNIVRTAVALLFTLIGVAGLYFLLNAEFLAAVQLVVYAGGTLILIVFGVMLTSKSPFSRFEPKLGEVMVAMSFALVLLVALIAGILRAKFNVQSYESGLYPLDKLGQALLGDFLVPFELSSVLLLVVMIGAAYLAKARKREEGNP
ncbi:MAG TPA: NADH-quinone oxidoreductase subunit J [Tepidisphaeraceae bacterium]|nr:NADH-quinone oxidoreductase subunit J [Tepidisphaeraceae bacterium]